VRLLIIQRYTLHSYIATFIIWLEDWKHFRVHFDGVHALGYDSAENEPIWMKSETLWLHCWGLALADFGCDSCSSESGRAGRIFFVR